MYDDYGGTYHCWLQVNKPLVYGQVIIITVIVIFTFTIIEAQCLKITQKSRNLQYLYFVYKMADLFKVTVTGYKLQLHFEKCNRLQLHEVTFRKNVTGYSYMKLLFKKM